MPNKIFSPRTPTATIAAGISLLIFLLTGCGERNGTDQTIDSLSADTALVGVDTSALSNKSIYDLIHDDQRFSRFAAAIDSTDLDQTLSGPGPFTVFAPTNEALGQTDQALLQKENEDELRDLLLSHVANGKKTASALSGQTVRTLAGGDIVVSGSGESLRVGEARVIEADIDAANGVIHAVGQVLSPSMQDEGL